LPALLPEGRGLAHPPTEEIERGAPGMAVTQDLDLLHTRRVDEERPLHADAARDSAYGDLPIDAAVADAQDRALEVLQPLAVPFDDPDAEAHGVTGPDLREIGLELFAGKRVQEVVHRNGDGAHEVLDILPGGGSSS